MSDDASLAAWEERLLAAEADLHQREAQAMAEVPTLTELKALAAEGDKLAADRDALAGAHDNHAFARDEASLARDSAASGRDRTARAVAEDTDLGFPDRFLSGRDRDHSASDRSDAHDDRSRSAQARERAASDRDQAATDRQTAADARGDLEREVAGLRDALNSRLVIGQAEGLLMMRYDLPSLDAAFALLVRLSQHGGGKLRDVAARIVRDATAGADD